MELILEIRSRDNETPLLSVGGGVIAFSPAVDEDYWTHRVRLSDTQAVLGFPKYTTIGIGFAVEKDYNTNLPYTSPTDDIVRHISSNKGDKSINDVDVRRAVRMIQDAVIAQRAEQRRALVRHARETLSGPVSFDLYNDVVHHLHSMLLEQTALQAEIEHHQRQTELAKPSTDLVHVGPADPDATYDADVRRAIEQIEGDDSRLRVPVLLPPEDTGGGQHCGFITQVARLGVPTRDGRTLEATGKFELMVSSDAPVFQMPDGITHHTREPVGRIVGMWRVDDGLFVFGMAAADVAAALNGGGKALAMDLDADIALPNAERPGVWIMSGRLRSARLIDPEDFAWNP